MNLITIKKSNINYNYIIGLDGQSVIIFGGGTSDFNYISSSDALYVLNLANLNWFVPKVSGKIPGTRMHHKANIIGKYMVISFGKYNFNNVII